MAESRVDMLDERIGRLEKKVDDGFARVDARFDEVYEAMGQGFAEHRRLLMDHIDGRVEGLRSDLRRDLEREVGAVRADLKREVGSVRAEMRDGFAAVNARLDAHIVETGTRFDRLEGKLDAFVHAQSAVNRRLLEYLDRQA